MGADRTNPRPHCANALYVCTWHAELSGGRCARVHDMDPDWQRKGATLSDKTAGKEFGLTQDEIVRAIRAGKLQYRQGSIYGNPFLRLLRREVEALVEKTHGGSYLEEKKARTELARINRELKQLKAQMAELEKKKSELQVATAGDGVPAQTNTPEKARPRKTRSGGPRRKRQRNKSGRV